MKIIIISPAHPLRGGIASLTERLAQALHSAGHEVEIISFSLQYPSFLFPGKTQFTDDPAPTGVTIFSKINSINPLKLAENWLFIKKKKARRSHRPVLDAVFWAVNRHDFFGFFQKKRPAGFCWSTIFCRMKNGSVTVFLQNT